MIKDSGKNGGVGDEYPQQTRTADQRLEAKAIRLGWDIPQEKKAALIDRQIEIASDSSLSPRETTSAFKALVAANSQNVQLAISKVEDTKQGAEPVDPAKHLEIMRATIPSRQ